MTKLDGNYYPQLTGIRAIAAFMVFFFHFNPFHEGFIFHFVNEFHVGVTVFFVLSGFLITYRYIDSFEFSREWFSKYIINRVARIYPMYILITICAFIFAPDIVKTVPIFILNITFLRGFFNLYVLSGVPQGWSLTAEECFYFSAPFIFFLLKSIRLFIQPIFITLIGISLVSIFSRHYIYGFFENYTFMFGYTFFGRSLEFYIGIYLALRVKKLSRVEKKGFLLSLLGVLSIIFCILLALLTKKESDYNDDIHNPFEIAILLYLLPFAIGILFYGLLREKTYLSKLLGSGLFELLGKSSFVFYMIHVGFITIFLKKVFPIATPWGFISIFVCLNIISIILFKYVESPLNKLIRGLSKKNRRWAFQRA